MNSNQSIARLLAVASEALADIPVAGLPAGRLGQELAALLGQRNGFFAFESALLVRPTGDQPGGLGNWNDPTGWRSTYGGLATGLFFFAEDVFGCQFALAGERVVSFDAETGDTEDMGSTIAGWAQEVLADPDVVTGYPLAHEWQVANRPLGFGERLVPVKPFVIGGEFAVSNLRVRDDVKGMLWRGGLATAIQDLPDGAELTVEFDEE